MIDTKTEELLREKIEHLESIIDVYTPPFITMNPHTVDLLHSLFTGHELYYPDISTNKLKEYGTYKIMGIPVSIDYEDKSSTVYFEVRI